MLNKKAQTKNAKCKMQKQNAKCKCSESAIARPTRKPS